MPGPQPEPTPAASETLARNAAGGDRDSLAELFARLTPALHAWAQQRAQRELGIQACDLVADVWLRAIQALPRFEPDRFTFRRWLFGLAKHVLVDAQRRRCRQLRTEGPGGGTTRAAGLDQLPAELTSISQRAARAEDVTRLVEHLESLPDVDRHIVVHCGLEGMTQAQTAERLGLSREALAKRWQRLVARLRQLELRADMLAET